MLAHLLELGLGATRVSGWLWYLINYWQPFNLAIDFRIAKLKWLLKFPGIRYIITEM